jgi:regulation of enolase protein 1 (concanavalin A-like superfamily)
MKKKLLGMLVAIGGLCPALCQETDFTFHTELGPGWSWIREHPQFWRIGDHGLEVRIEPGNMWGAQNDAKNVLVRPAPDFSTNLVAVSAKVENNPSNQYEQVDLVCYYNDSNMVKLGEELVDGKLSIVMGREQADKTRTIAIIPLDSTSVQLQLVFQGDQVRGRFRAGERNPWREAGQCDLPAPQGIKPNLSLQFYQGTVEAEHWARVSEFRISGKLD